jgi:hypothetical protein
MDWMIGKVEEEPKQEPTGDPLTGKSFSPASDTKWVTMYESSVGQRKRNCEYRIWNGVAAVQCGSAGNLALPSGLPMCEFHLGMYQHEQVSKGLFKDCPRCCWCGGDGIYFLIDRPEGSDRNCCKRCYGVSGESFVMWNSVPAPETRQVEGAAFETGNLWDFLMKFSFRAGQPKPPSWMKAKIDEWFKAYRSGRGVR